MFLRGILLLAGLSATLAQIQNTAPNVRTVSFTECAPQFKIGNFFISGCTTLGLAQPSDKSWCKLAAPPAQGPKWAFCDIRTLPKRRALGGTSQAGVECNASTPLPGVRGSVVNGCYTRSAKGQFVCNAGGQLLVCAAGPVPGPTRATAISGGGSTAATSGGGSTAAQRANTSPNTSGSSSANSADLANKDALTNGGDSTEGAGTQMSTGAIAGIVVGTILALVGLAYAIFRCRQDPSKSDDGPKQPPTLIKIESTYGGSAADPQFDSLPVPPAAFAESSKRSSSQFGGGRPLTTNFNEEPQDEDYFDQVPLGQFVVSSTYATSLPDELDVMPGDILEVYREFDDGWGAAVNLTRGEVRGVFPLHCIEGA